MSEFAQAYSEALKKMHDRRAKICEPCEHNSRDECSGWYWPDVPCPKKKYGCSRCGMELPENAIHLSRNWPGRVQAVQKAYPNSEVSMCGMAEQYQRNPVRS